MSEPCLDPTCSCCESWRGLAEQYDRKLDRLRGALVAAGVPNRLVAAIEDPEADLAEPPGTLTGVVRPPEPEAPPSPPPESEPMGALNENRPDLQHITADGETTLCGIDMADWTGPASFLADWCEECQTLDAAGA